LGSRHLMIGAYELRLAEGEHGTSRSCGTQPQLGKPLSGQVDMEDTVLD